MMTSSFGNPARFGIRTWRSGFPPAMQAAVACVSAAEQPDETIPQSAFVSSASLAPMPAISSSRWTYCWEASAIAARASGSIVDPLMMVNVPRPLMRGRTPIER